MRKYPRLIMVGMLLTALNSQSGAQTASAPSDAFGRAVLDYKTQLEECLTGLSKKDNSREERETAAFSSSVLLESYEQFARGTDNNRQSRLASDPELMNKLCLLYIAYAEYQQEEANVNANPPSVTALERAFNEYRSACACLKAMNDRKAVAQIGAKIESGLARTIAGLNKYADWFEKDVFMNPDGKKWEANPAPQAEKLRAELSGKASTSPSDEIAYCEKAISQVLKDIQKAREKKDNTKVMDNMILGARWLTTLLRKSPDAFVIDYRKFDMIIKPVMEEAGKDGGPERAKEFSRFYEPLKTHYKSLSSEKK